MDGHRSSMVWVCLLLSLIVSVRSGFAQGDTAALNGRVTDASGLAVAGAKVEAVNVNTNGTYSGETTSAGLYNISALLPGMYRITVQKVGFEEIVKPDVEFHVADILAVNFVLQIGSISQSVTVEGGASPIELVSSSIGNLVESTTVRELPLNGRDWTQLATLQPGVNTVVSIQAATSGTDRAGRGYGSQLTVAGAVPSQNNYLIDGISVAGYTNGGPGGVSGATLGVDAVQEYSVMTSNYPASYGRTTGGIFNSITRTGTNRFHGNAYEFIRNSAIDARDFFNQGTIPPFKRNEFGGSLGGPIWKDHTFFFVDYEGLRQELGEVLSIKVPSPAARMGILCSIPKPGPSGCVTHQLTGAFNPDPATGIDRTVLPFLALWGPVTNGLLGNGDTGLYKPFGSQNTSENFLTMRFDHRFSDKDNAFGSFGRDAGTLVQPTGDNNVFVSSDVGSVFAAIGETHTFSAQLVNAVRFGYSRSSFIRPIATGINPAASSTALGTGGGNDAPRIDVSGLTTIGGGVNQTSRNDEVQNSFQAYEDLSWTKGIHSLKFGFNYERIQDNLFGAQPASDFVFGSLTAFLQNQPDSLFGEVNNVVFPPHEDRDSIFGAYALDDIRLKSNLTVNLGLRYEMSTIPTEKNGKLVALRNPTDSTPSAVGSPIFLHNPTLRNFEPRVGFAWDPFRNGKTSVRGGFGMFDSLPLPYLFGQIAVNEAPFVQGGSVPSLPAGSFILPAYNIFAGQVAASTGLRYPYIQPDPKRSYAMQWNLTIQRELAPSLAATVSYVGSRGIHEPFRSDDINTTLPTLTSAGYLWPSPIGSGKVLSPTVGRMDTLQWTSESFYDGLQAVIEKRMSHGIQAQASYTWSKAIDEGDGARASDMYLNSIPGLFYFLPSYRRAVADFNIPQNLTINFIWQVPTPTSFHGPLAWTARGWQLGGIVTLHSGLPFTPLIGGDPLGLNNTAAFDYPNILTGPGCNSLINPGNVDNYVKLQCFGLPMATSAIAGQCVPFAAASAAGTCSNLLGNGGRNEVHGPPTRNVDFSVVKNNQIKENLNIQFRAEFFNIFNHPNFSPPIDNSTIFNQDGSAVGGAGALDATASANRELQFALKVIF
jgi:hypothetical protein